MSDFLYTMQWIAQLIGLSLSSFLSQWLLTICLFLSILAGIVGVLLVLRGD